MNLAKLWFFEFGAVDAEDSNDPYDVVVAASARSAIDRYVLCHEFEADAPPKRMERTEVEAAGKCTPLVCQQAEDWTCLRWLEEIEAAQAREAREAKLAAKQVELFT